MSLVLARMVGKKRGAHDDITFITNVIMHSWLTKMPKFKSTPLQRRLPKVTAHEHIFEGDYGNKQLSPLQQHVEGGEGGAQVECSDVAHVRYCQQHRQYLG